MDPHSRVPKKNTSHGNEVLPQDTTQLNKYHVTNEKVHAKIQQAIGPHEDLLTIVKRRKLQWYGHVSGSSGLVKTILQGTVKGRRRQGRQRKSGKTTSGNGQAWSSASPRGQWRTGKNGENWLQNQLWCPNDPHSKGLMMMRSGGRIFFSSADSHFVSVPPRHYRSGT